MKGYALANRFGTRAVEDFEAATKLVERLPERAKDGYLIRCHEVVRALKTLLPNHKTWVIQDGSYRTVEHTWLYSSSGIILDLYSVARFPMVQLFDGWAFCHRGTDLFKPGSTRTDIREKDVRLLRKAARAG